MQTTYAVTISPWHLDISLKSPLKTMTPSGDDKIAMATSAEELGNPTYLVSYDLPKYQIL